MTTKDKIIDVLATLLRQDENIQNISIAKIAELANIGKSTVYEHFDSKETLINETYKYLSLYYCQRIIAPLKHNTFEKAYKEMVLRIMRNAQEANELMMAILSEGQGIKLMEKDEIKLIMDNVQDKIQDVYLHILKMGVGEGIIHPALEQTKEKGHVIRALTMGIVMQRINEHIDLSEEDAVAYLYKYTVIALNA